MPIKLNVEPCSICFVNKMLWLSFKIESSPLIIVLQNFSGKITRKVSKHGSTFRNDLTTPLVSGEEWTPLILLLQLSSQGPQLTRPSTISGARKALGDAHQRCDTWEVNLRQIKQNEHSRLLGESVRLGMSSTGNCEQNDAELRRA
jgi:hypothetical protein